MFVVYVVGFDLLRFRWLCVFACLLFSGGCLWPMPCVCCLLCIVWLACCDFWCLVFGLVWLWPLSMVCGAFD